MHVKDLGHGKDRDKRTTKKGARQCPNTPHGKDSVHDKGVGYCRASSFAVRAAVLHGKAAFA
jgi:hypothetical protein